jgi:hypothetical protein
MISSLWEWFIIGLVVAGVASGIVSFVIFIYLFSFYCFFTDKLTSAFTAVSNLASYPFKSLGF